MSILSRLAKSPSAPLAYIGETDDLAHLTGGETAIILGGLIIMNLNEPPHEGGNVAHIPQPPRESRRRGFTLARQKGTHLHLSIHPLLAQHIQHQARGTRFILAADAMFALAAQRKTTATLLICNGYESPQHTYFDTYLFHAGQLVRITEAIIKPAHHARYAVDVKQQIDEVLNDFPDAHILWTAPLSPLPLDGYTLESVGAEIFAGKFPLVTHDGRTTPASPKIPAFVTAAMLLGCAGVIGYDVMTLTNKRNAYDRLTRDTAANVPSTALDVLQARARWQRETDAVPVESIVAPAQRLLLAVAQNPEWHISKFALATQRGPDSGAPGSPDASPLSITLIVPAVPNVSATDQTQPIIAALSQRTGARLVVKPQAITPLPQEGRLRITVDVEK